MAYQVPSFDNEWFNTAVDTEINVFGVPITNSGTRLQRAREALNTKYADDKRENALHFVKQLKEKYGDGTSTLCIVYNATGDSITYETFNDWHGHVYRRYPEQIANGQWGVFLHVKPDGATIYGSSGAVVYRGPNNNNQDCGWLLSWSNPFNKLFYANQCYTEIRNREHYYDNGVWDAVWDLTSCYETRDTWSGCYSTVKIEDGPSSPILEATFTLEGANTMFVSSIS